MSAQRCRSGSVSIHPLDTAPPQIPPSQFEHNSTLRPPPLSVPRSSSYSFASLSPIFDQTSTSISSRVSMSTIGSAAGVMKKLLRRRRDTHCGESSGGSISSAGSLSLQSFVIIGGHGAVPGTTVYDIEPSQPTGLSCLSRRSPAPTSIFGSHGADIPTSPVSPRSPRSPDQPHPTSAREHRGVMAFTFPGRAHSRLGSIAESSLNAPGASDQWIRKKINRRSLSADSPFAGISPNPRGKTGSSSKYEKSRSQEAPTEVETREGSTFAQHQRQMREQEFLQNSIEFLKTHHNGDQKTECWKNRNKRKTLRPDMRQTSSCVADLGSSRAGSTVDPVIWEEENGSDAWEPVSIWSELGTEELHHDDLNGPVQDANKVSPTQFYDSTQSRKVLRDHLLSDEGAFEQMLAHGFPSTSKASSTAESGEGAGNFMTLRLTLTPWHARADENSLYGGNTDRTKHPHLRSMVNKLLSRSSGPLPASSPRSMSLTSSPLTHLDSINGRHTPSLPSPINSSIYSRDSLLTKMGPVRERSGSLSSTTGSMDARMHLCKDSIALTRSLAVKGRPVSPRKDQGFRIVDPSAMYSSAMTSKVIEHETLHRCISPPLTPSPIEKQSQHEANSLQQPMPSSNQKSPGASATSTYNRDNYITPRPKKCISSTLPTPPIVPPRRKSSTPSLYFPGERLMPASPKIVASPSLPCTLRESRQQCASPSASGARGIQNMFNISLTPPKESNLSGWMDRSSSPSHCHSSPILRGETCSSVTNSPRQYSYDHNKQQDLQQRLTWQGHHPFHDSHRPNEYSARPDQETSNDCAQEPVRAVAEGVGSSMCCSSSENLLACVPTPPVTPKTPTKWTAPEPNFYSSSTIQQDHLKCHHPHPRRPGMLSPMSEQQPNVGPHHV